MRPRARINRLADQMLFAYRRAACARVSWHLTTEPAIRKAAKAAERAAVAEAEQYAGQMDEWLEA